MKSTKSGRSSRSSGRDDLMQSQLMSLFESEIKDILWAEKAITKAIPKMIKKSSSEELMQVLEDHLRQTEVQITRLERIFGILGKRVVSKECKAMVGLIKEGTEKMEETDDGPMLDAAIIASAQKIEHYEIASYGTLRQFAETLGLDEAVNLLQETLDEEKMADKNLSEVAVSAVNIEASAEIEK